MASRKEEEKNEKIVRGLTKLPENRKCINCGSLGPQYVCTNFSIFICMTCSGLHREFTHRVKSISMAHFSSAEVGALQAGGNQRARDIYLKEWDSGRHSLPDSSNPEKLRDFIKSVYVERRFCGDRPDRQRPPPGKWSDTDETEVRRPKYSQSPSYEDRYDDRRYSYTNNRPASRGSDRGFDDKMSPASDRERDRDRRYSDDRDRRYDDRGYDDRDRRYEDRRSEYEDRRVDEPKVVPRRTSDDWDARRRPPSYRGGETPPVRSVRDILGEDVPKLRVEDASRAPNGRVEDSESSPRSVSSQGDGRLRPLKSLDSSKSLDSASTNGNTNTVVVQRSISESLIDFAAEPEPAKPSSNSGTSFDPFAEPFAAPKPSTNLDPFATSTTTTTTNSTFDPFAASETAKPSTAADPFAASGGTTGWASFDLSPPKPPPASTATVPPASSFFDQPTNHAPHHTMNGTMPPQQWASSGTPGQGPASGFQHQPSNQVPQTPAFKPPQLPEPSGRRPIPEGLFAMPPPGPYGTYMQMPGNFAQAPPPPFYSHMPPGPYGQQSRSNPFDLPGDAATFPNMRNALPAYGAGPQSSPAPALGGPSPQWSQPAQHTAPASYPPAPFQGAGYNQHQQAPVPMQANFGGGFMNGPAGYGGSQPPMQPAAGNPFG